MSNRSIHYVDKYVGERLRKRRLILRISQEQLANCVNLTFQQIQKYEKGLNRISSSKLYEFAHFLKINIEYFFQGLTTSYNSKEGEFGNELKDIENNEQYVALQKLECNGEVVKLSQDIELLIGYFTRIKSAEVRERILNLIESLTKKSE